MKYQQAVVESYFLECGLPKPQFELQHIPGRKFRLDIAFPNKVGVEIQGGLWIAGKHARGSGVKKDMEKRNLQIMNGWRVIEVEPKDLCTIETVMMIRALINDR